MQQAALGASTSASSRIASVDILRGVVMALMALDHVRDFFHVQALQFDPLDFAQSYPALFATRWATHFCAPVFVFLSGVSIHLQRTRGRSHGGLSRRLLARGLWLVLIELTLVGFAWSFSFDFLFLQVIWAIGWSMVALAALVWLPTPVVLAIGLAIVAGHNLLDPLQPAQFGALAPLWSALHESGPILVDGQLVGFFAYPLIAWVGVMALGYGLGPVFRLDPPVRRRTLYALGAGAVATFVLLRLLDGYGDANNWEVQATFAQTAMDVLSTTKYPPSLQFLCMTLGPALLSLPLLEHLRGRAAEPWMTFGAVPFFFYVLHIYLAHGLSAALSLAQGYPVWGVGDLFRGAQGLQGFGVSLPTTYGVWLLVLALLYPPCRWFAALKRGRRDWWLSYL
jgi:uncharacterized membrane protein